MRRRRDQIPAIDEKRAVNLVLEMMALPGVSGREGPVVQFITRRLRRAGIAASRIHTDDAHRRAATGGEVGNLICRLPGRNRRGLRRLLAAHLDTVPLCAASRPVLRNGRVRSADPAKALGADNRAGAAVLLTAALELARHDVPHPPLSFFWPVQEETALVGVHFASLSLLGRPKLAFNFDGGDASDVTIGATGDYQIQIEVKGRASHAGAHPEQGVSAVVIASCAIAELQANGWLGLIVKGRNRGTSNVGTVTGGGATNVVTDRVELHAEARSHDPAFRRRILDAYRKAFERAARQVTSVDGKRGRTRLRAKLAYESFRLADTEPCVLEAERALAAIGVAGQRRIVNGGLDANWLTARGIPTVTLGCGQRHAHTVNEELNVGQFLKACRVALLLATGVT